MNNEQTGTRLTAFAVFNTAVFFILLLAILCVLGSERLIAKDEGFYAEAARLVSSGSLLYRDFFYPQAPYIPFVLSPWSSSWESVRLIVSVFCWLQALIFFLYTYAKSRAIIVSLLWVIAFVLNHFVLAWFLTAQSYIFTSVFLFPSALLLAWISENPAYRHRVVFSAFSGALLSLAICSRAYAAVLIPIYLLVLQRRFKFRSEFFTFSIAGVVVAIPAVIMFLSSPDAFLYNNLGYHLSRSTRTFLDSLQNKEVIFRIIYGMRDTRQFSTLGVPVLYWMATAICFYAVVFTRKLHALSLLSFALIFISFLPNPTYVQYFCLPVPLLMAAMVCVLTKEQGYDKIHSKILFTCIPCILIGTSLFGFKSDMTAYYRTGNGVIGLNPKIAADWNLERLVQIRNSLNSLPLDGSQTVFSFWSGYLIGTDHKMMHGMENHFGIPASRRLEADERRKYKLATLGELLDRLQSENVTVAILTKRQYRGNIKLALEKSCFELHNEHGGILILLRARQGSICQQL